jgi:hypothetical protein
LIVCWLDRLEVREGFYAKQVGSGSGSSKEPALGRQPVALDAESFPVCPPGPHRTPKRYDRSRTADSSLNQIHLSVHVSPVAKVLAIGGSVRNSARSRAWSTPTHCSQT